jgi:hypothetical protein
MFVRREWDGEIRTYLYRPAGWGMRFPEDMRKCVVFLARVLDKGGQPSLSFRGTGFIVALPSRVKDAGHHYIVTARHVADNLLLGDWAARFNTKCGKSVDLLGNRETK